ncbi:unnamed protein product [Fusarium fujikuroi]|nr:unnamed protein product [Fusarium fujikuroi]
MPNNNLANPPKTSINYLPYKLNIIIKDKLDKEIKKLNKTYNKAKIFTITIIKEPYLLFSIKDNLALLLNNINITGQKPNLNI